MLTAVLAVLDRYPSICLTCNFDIMSPVSGTNRSISRPLVHCGAIRVAHLIIVTSGPSGEQLLLHSAVVPQLRTSRDRSCGRPLVIFSPFSRALFRARARRPLRGGLRPTLTGEAERAHAKACRLRGECRSCLTRRNDSSAVSLSLSPTPLPTLGSRRVQSDEATISKRSWPETSRQ